ncbi:MAG: hypothetical protein ACTS73_08510 [Arsenophonus sp. NEOnobi-MAG3]
MNCPCGGGGICQQRERRAEKCPDAGGDEDIDISWIHQKLNISVGDR